MKCEHRWYGVGYRHYRCDRCGEPGYPLDPVRLAKLGTRDREPTRSAASTRIWRRMHHDRDY